MISFKTIVHNSCCQRGVILAANRPGDGVGRETSWEIAVKHMNEEIDSGESSLRYSGIATFMRTPLVRDLSQVDLALIGVPFDG